MQSLRIATVFLLLSAVSAFQNMSPLLTSTKINAPSTTARFVILTDEETASIMRSASDCAEGECSIDDVSELIFELKEQRKEMQTRLDKVMKMIADLENLNTKDGRQTDEVRGFVKDMLRVFSTDKPKISPVGYSGDVGSGSTTAYDALPPKKWVPEGKK